jgi:hypothetical protein
MASLLSDELMCVACGWFKGLPETSITTKTIFCENTPVENAIIASKSKKGRVFVFIINIFLFF